MRFSMVGLKMLMLTLKATPSFVKDVIRNKYLIWFQIQLCHLRFVLEAQKPNLLFKTQCGRAGSKCTEVALCFLGRTALGRQV